MTSMRIAMIGLRGLPARAGGVERHVEELATRLVDRGHEVTVFCRPGYAPEAGETYRGHQAGPAADREGHAAARRSCTAA